MVRECVTHHHACDCREAQHRAEVDMLRAALGYALPAIGCGTTADKIAKLLAYPNEDELNEYERCFLALLDGHIHHRVPVHQCPGCNPNT